MSTNDRPKNRYIAVPVWVLRRKHVSLAAKLLWGYLQDRIGKNGDCWPSIRRIAEDLGTTKTTTAKKLVELESAGLIVVSRSHRKPNHYKTKCPPPIISRVSKLVQPSRQTCTRIDTQAVPDSGTNVYQNLDPSCTRGWSPTIPLNHSTEQPQENETPFCAADAAAGGKPRRRHVSTRTENGLAHEAMMKALRTWCFEDRKTMPSEERRMAGVSRVLRSDGITPADIPNLVRACLNTKRFRPSPWFLLSKIGELKAEVDRGNGEMSDEEKLQAYCDAADARRAAKEAAQAAAGQNGDGETCPDTAHSESER